MPHFEACPNCQSRKIAPRRGFEALKLALCSDCGFVFDTRQPTDAELETHYAQYAYGAQKPCPPATIASYEALLDTFEPYRKTGNMMDVGCGQGDFLVLAQARGWQVYGTEFSSAGVALCAARGLTMHEGPLDAQTFADIQFDIITSLEVFEHINTGPTELALFYDKLRPGGLAYLTTPNFNALLRWFERSEFKMVTYPEHISFYTTRAMGHLARATGFEVDKTSTTGLDLGRLRSLLPRKISALKGTATPTPADTRAMSQQARARILDKAHLRLAKAVINTGLKGLGAGDTLKTWLHKPRDGA